VKAFSSFLSTLFVHNSHATTDGALFFSLLAAGDHVKVVGFPQWLRDLRSRDLQFFRLSFRRNIYIYIYIYKYIRELADNRYWVRIELKVVQTNLNHCHGARDVL